MNKKRTYRTVCSPKGVWSVQEMVEADYRYDWMTAHRCTSQGEAGYHEAKQWIEEQRRM